MPVSIHRLFSVSLLALAATAACTGPTDSLLEDGDAVDEAKIDEELTSNTALARTLTFQGKVFVTRGASDTTVISQIRRQTQSAFGALHGAHVGVNTRELREINPATFKRRPVTLVDGASATEMDEVTYTYTDAAVVPKPMARRSGLTLGLLNNGAAGQIDRVMTECTTNDRHARDFRGSIWYVFNPSLPSCQRAIAEEQKTIDAARAKLGDPKTQVTTTEVNRLYLPSTMSLGPAATNNRSSYPEYDRLFTGGVEKGKLVIGMVNGLMADWAAGEVKENIDDSGYRMFFEGLQAIFAARPEFKLKSIEGVADLTVTANGKTYKPSFEDVMHWELDGTGYPAGLTYAERRPLRVAIGNLLSQKWIGFEAPVNVTIRGETQPLTIVLNTYLGAGGASAPHKRAVKTSDIIVYNGHSYIGYGPLDPSNFAASDFPASYQILFVNGCVSYNYYHKDYIPLKAGGTRNLDLVTNGLESWVNGSGAAMGRFVGAIISGKQPTYKQILKASEFTSFGYDWGMDALRVVDGELDNVYSPRKKPITIGK